MSQDDLIAKCKAAGYELMSETRKTLQVEAPNAIVSCCEHPNVKEMMDTIENNQDYTFDAHTVKICTNCGRFHGQQVYKGCEIIGHSEPIPGSSTITVTQHMAIQYTSKPKGEKNLGKDSNL